HSGHGLLPDRRPDRDRPGRRRRRGAGDSGSGPPRPGTFGSRDLGRPWPADRRPRPRWVRQRPGRRRRGGGQMSGAGEKAPNLRADALAREYDGFVALKPLDLSIAAGESVALIGANGAGKTTLLTLAAGLLEPSAGGIAVGDSQAGSL